MEDYGGWDVGLMVFRTVSVHDASCLLYSACTSTEQFMTLRFAVSISLGVRFRV